MCCRLSFTEIDGEGERERQRMRIIVSHTLIDRERSNDGGVEEQHSVC